MLGGTPAHDGGSTARPGPPKEQWVTPIDHSYGEVESSPVLTEKLVLSAAGRTVFALKRSSGELAWENSVAQQQILSSGCLAGDVFVVGSDDGVLYAFTATNGTSKWRFRAGGEFTGGATYDAASELIFVGSSARKLHVLQRNGALAYEFTAEANVASTPAVDAERVYFGDDSGNFFALEKKTGVLAWKLQPSPGESIRSPAVLGEEAIYFSSGDPDGKKRGHVHKVGYDGSPEWNSECAGGSHACYSCWTAPADLGPVVVVGCGLDTVRKGAIWGLKVSDGSVAWKVDAKHDCQTSSPVRVGGAAVLGCIDGSLHAVSAEGKVLWTYPTATGIWATAAVDGDELVTASHDAVHAVRLDQRAEL